MISLVVFNLDGTLLSPHQEGPIRPRVLRTVRGLLELGVDATLATGRTWEYARHRSAELGLNPALPMVTGQGASLVESGSGTILSEVHVPPDIALRVAEQAQQSEGVFSLYYRDPQGKLHITINRMEKDAEYYFHLLGRETVVIKDFQRRLQEGWSLLKFVVFTVEPQAPAIWQEWAGPEAHVGRTHSDLVEGTAAGVNKGIGVKALLTRLKLAPEQVLAIGDQENDIPMFGEVGRSVAMGHAPDSVKACADWVAPTYEEDGVAAALEHFFPELARGA